MLEALCKGALTMLVLRSLSESNICGGQAIEKSTFRRRKCSHYIYAQSIEDMMGYRRAHWHAQIIFFGRSLEGRRSAAVRHGRKWLLPFTIHCCVCQHGPNRLNRGSSKTACGVSYCYTPVLRRVGSGTVRAAVEWYRRGTESDLRACGSRRTAFDSTPLAPDLQ